MEKGVSALERAAGEGDGAALVQSASEATDTLSHAVGYVLALQQLAAEGRVPAEGLQQYGAGLEARVGAAQGLLHTLLSQAIQARLAAASWPPPLSATGGEGGGGEEAGAGWPGFAAAPGGEAALTELQQLAVPLLTLQRVVQHAEFAALAAAPEGLTQEGPVLWIAEELAAPLAARLRHHFAEGLPTDRADKPEWLFATVLRAARQLAPHAQAFQVGGCLRRGPGCLAEPCRRGRSLWWMQGIAGVSASLPASQPPMPVRACAPPHLPNMPWCPTQPHVRWRPTSWDPKP